MDPFDQTQLIDQEKVSPALSTRKRRVVVIGSVVAAVVLLLGAAAYMATRKDNTSIPDTAMSDVPSSSPSAAVSSSSSEPFSVPTTTPQDTAIPSPSAPVISLPQDAQRLISSFYNKYKLKDSIALEKLFTPDDSAELKSLRSRLFKGIDTTGNPGGPTLFSTNSADHSATLFQIKTIKDLGDGKWQALVTEDRVNGLGKELPQVETKLTLIQSQGSEFGWLVDEYAYTTSSGKYSAFLLQ